MTYVEVVVIVLFILGGVFGMFASNKGDFEEYGLIKSWWDKYRTGFGIRRVKRELSVAKDERLISLLKRSLLFLRLSYAFLVASFLITMLAGFFK
jgi:hypothetical protein